MITELREVKMNTPNTDEPESLLSIQDLHVWYELRRFGFGHAGYVKAVDGVSFELEEGKRWRLSVSRAAASPVL